ncbi:hypothetical protein [Ferrovum sp.]|jgi:hypothetical protein|uniref:hypothetical protein n=1 Tax=Ferrovum sp. TaxID=2609467 RepID=UPI00261992A8|nr:hypothetical protein [Ferrovum sp.]
MNSAMSSIAVNSSTASWASGILLPVLEMSGALADELPASAINSYDGVVESEWQTVIAP